MAFGKLYGPEPSANGRTLAVLVAAKHNDLDLEHVKTEASSTAAFNQSAEYRKVHPLGKIPAFEGANGFTLFEAIAIAIYVTSQNEKTTLLGKTKQDYASIVSWLSFANSEVLVKLASWYRPLMGVAPYNKKTVDEAQKVALATLAVWESRLTENTYLVGERITLADIFSASLVVRAFGTVLDKSFRSAHPAITRWFTTIVNQESFKAVLPEVTFVEESIKYTPPKKEAKPAAPKAAPKAAEEDDEPAPEKKAKHPLEALGKPTYVLDEWKRQYSNEETREVALPWFWKTYNPEEFSLWKVDYKYNEELKLTFMATNLIGGFHARLEASRKYLFGAQGVYGANYACVIKGVFMVRGQEFAPAFDVAPDWESYDFTKLDHTSEADRKYIEDMWAWDVPAVTADGKELPFADGHVFK